MCVTATLTSLAYQQYYMLNSLLNKESFKHSKMITYLLLHLPTKLIVYSSDNKREFYSVYALMCDDDNYRKVVSDEDDELPILDML